MGRRNEPEKHLCAMCQCGKVKFEAVGPPILTDFCYCTSCQEAGRQFEQLASAPPADDKGASIPRRRCRRSAIVILVAQSAT